MIPLSGAEYSLLRVFLDHPNRVLSRDQLIDFAFDRDTERTDRSVDSQVSRLRHRLRDDAKEPALIKTVRAQGYVPEDRGENCTSGEQVEPTGQGNRRSV